MRHAGHNLITTMESPLNVNYDSLDRIESETQSQTHSPLKRTHRIRSVAFYGLALQPSCLRTGLCTLSEAERTE
jgi:hypothetical protein